MIAPEWQTGLRRRPGKEDRRGGTDRSTEFGQRAASGGDREGGKVLLPLAVGPGMAGGDDTAHAALADELAALGCYARDAAAVARNTLHPTSSFTGGGSGTQQYGEEFSGWDGDVSGFPEDLNSSEINSAAYQHPAAFSAYGGEGTGARLCCFYAAGSCREGQSCQFSHGETPQAPASDLRESIPGFTEYPAASEYPWSNFSAADHGAGDFASSGQYTDSSKVPLSHLLAHVPTFSSFGRPLSTASSLLSSGSPTQALASGGGSVGGGSGITSPSPLQLRPISAPDSVGGFAFGAPGSAAFSNTRGTLAPGHYMGRTAFSHGTSGRVQGGGQEPVDVENHAPQRAGYGADVSSFSMQIPFDFGAGNGNGTGYGSGGYDQGGLNGLYSDDRVQQSNYSDMQAQLAQMQANGYLDEEIRESPSLDYYQRT